MQHSNFHTIKFISALTIIVSLLLSITSETLKSMQIENIELDKKKNILKVIGLDVSKIKNDKIPFEYNNRIKDLVLNIRGEIIPNVFLKDLEVIENKSTGEIIYFKDTIKYYPAYVSSNPKAFVIPISGKGLWSTLYGYFALEDDYNTVKGITFYEHKETPGLGGEVEKEWFQNNFKEKNIYDLNGEMISISVIKGKASDNLKGADLNHAVDGISGATITSKGVTTFLKRELNKYKLFFDKNRDK